MDTILLDTSVLGSPKWAPAAANPRAFMSGIACAARLNAERVASVTLENAAGGPAAAILHSLR